MGESYKEKQKRKQMLRKELLELMLEVLVDLLKSDELSATGRLNGVMLLDGIRHELGLDRDY